MTFVDDAVLKLVELDPEQQWSQRPWTARRRGDANMPPPTAPTEHLDA